MDYQFPKEYKDRVLDFIKNSDSQTFAEYKFPALEAFSPYSSDLKKMVEKNNFTNFKKFIKNEVYGDPCDGAGFQQPVLNENRPNCYPLSVNMSKAWPHFTFANCLLVCMFGVANGEFKTLDELMGTSKCSTKAFGVFIPGTVTMPVLVLVGKPTKIQLAACRTLKHLWGVMTCIVEDGGIFDLHDYLATKYNVEPITDKLEITRLYLWFGSGSWIPAVKLDKSAYLPSLLHIVDGTYHVGGRIAYV